MTDTVTTARGIRERVMRTTAWEEARRGGEAMAAALTVARAVPKAQVDRLASATRVVLTGAGSSYYIAQVAAAVMRSVGRVPAEAAPLSEVLLRPSSVLWGSDPTSQPIIVVSRSGTTTEALDVVRAVQREGHPTIGVTCRPDSEMATLADTAMAVPEADESAIVMTRSFTAMVTLLMRLAARLGDARFAQDLDRLPEQWAATASFVDAAFELAAADPSRVIVLGGGPALGLANEAVLKLTETSQVPAAAYHPLEFRHGPISVCEPGMLVVGILGDGPAVDAERAVLEEAAALGATTWLLGPDGPGADLDGVARLPLVLHDLQALALGVAVRRGRDPDSPRHLGQVVVLGGA